LVGGPYFNFRPYHYGPFDSAVYVILDALRREGLLEIIGANTSSRAYALTGGGQKEAERLLNLQEPKARNFIVHSSEFVRSLNFSALVSAIYKAFPDMRANSVFQS